MGSESSPMERLRTAVWHRDRRTLDDLRETVIDLTELEPGTEAFDEARDRARALLADR